MPTSVTNNTELRLLKFVYCLGTDVTHTLFLLLQAVFARFCRGINEVERLIQSKGWEFQKSDNLGYILTCPSNIGNGLRCGVHVKLPLLSKVCIINS